MRMKHSRSSVQFRPYDDSIAEHMKYSESMSTLKQMRDADEESKVPFFLSSFVGGTIQKVFALNRDAHLSCAAAR